VNKALEENQVNRLGGTEIKTNPKENYTSRR
jgi:hypothetical protein